MSGVYKNQIAETWNLLEIGLEARKKKKTKGVGGKDGRRGKGRIYCLLT